MYPMAEMHFYWWRENGKIVVQNAIGSYLGQKHEHTEKDFKRWIEEGKIKLEYLHEIKKSV